MRLVTALQEHEYWALVSYCAPNSVELRGWTHLLVRGVYACPFSCESLLHEVLRLSPKDIFVAFEKLLLLVSIENRAR